MNVHTHISNNKFYMKSIQIAIDVGVPEGVISVIATQPFDTVKARMQTIGSIDFGGGEYLYKGPLDCFHKIVKREGFLSLYRGVSIPLFTTVPVNVFTYYTYNFLSLKQLNDGKKMTPEEVLLDGGMSGGLQACFLSPIERIKFYMQIPSGYFGIVKTPRSIVASIYQTEGPFGLFRGTCFCVIRDSMNTAAAFLTYYWLKINVLKKYKQMDPRKRKSYYEEYFEIWISGGVSGLIAAVLTTPIDFFKTRYQFKPVLSSEIIEDIKAEAERRNVSIVRLSYSALPTILVKNFFHYGLLFLGYEIYKQLLRKAQVMKSFESEGIVDDKLLEDKIEDLKEEEEDSYVL